MAGRRFAVFMCMALLGNAFAVPTEIRRRRQVTEKTVGENEVSSQEISVSMKNYGQDASTTESPNTYLPATQSSRGDTPAAPSAPSAPDDDDDDDDDDFPAAPAQTSGGGSSIFSLLNLISALFPGSSGSNVIIRNMIRQFLIKYQHIIFPQLSPRKSVADNEIELDYDLKPPPVRQELQDSESEDDASGTEEESDENDGAEESGENNGNGDVDSKQESNGDDDASDYDSDEPPGGGDGQGGGILGLLAGLSGGEDGQSDLGSLLATVSGIVANLSGDGIDVNALIASGLGLFVGLLSEGNENPGAVVASYLTTSLDSLSGGGSKNNGAFFGAFLSKLLAGTSGALQDSSEENGDKKPMIDSAGFFASFLMALLGDLSKGSSGGAWR